MAEARRKGRSSFPKLPLTNEEGLEVFDEQMRSGYMSAIEDEGAREIASNEAPSPRVTKDLLADYRLEDETFEQYKERQASVKRHLKMYKRYGPEGLERVLRYLEVLSKQDEERRNRISFTEGNEESNGENGTDGQA